MGAKYASPAGEAVRNAVNQWIRTTNQLRRRHRLRQSHPRPSQPLHLLLHRRLRRPPPPRRRRLPPNGQLHRPNPLHQIARHLCFSSAFFVPALVFCFSAFLTISERNCHSERSEEPAVSRSSLPQTPLKLSPHPSDKQTVIPRARDRGEPNILPGPPLIFPASLFSYFSSIPAKKYPISNAAVSSASDRGWRSRQSTPQTSCGSFPLPPSPGRRAHQLAQIGNRVLLLQHHREDRPRLMNSVSSPKNGRAACT